MFKEKILAAIQGSKHYWDPNRVAREVGCSSGTALKWLKALYQEGRIRRHNHGSAYTARYWYLSNKTCTTLEK
jgi:hypothetical protein